MHRFADTGWDAALLFATASATASFRPSRGFHPETSMGFLEVFEGLPSRGSTSVTGCLSPRSVRTPASCDTRAIAFRGLIPARVRCRRPHHLWYDGARSLPDFRILQGLDVPPPPQPSKGLRVILPRSSTARLR